MTGRRARLARLEARRRESSGDMLGVFEADLGAGLWRERTGGQGRTLPLSLGDFETGGRLAESDGALLLIGPPFPAKVIAGIHWGDI